MLRFKCDNRNVSGLCEGLIYNLFSAVANVELFLLLMTLCPPVNTIIFLGLNFMISIITDMK